MSNDFEGCQTCIRWERLAANAGADRVYPRPSYLRQDALTDAIYVDVCLAGHSIESHGGKAGRKLNN